MTRLENFGHVIANKEYLTLDPCHMLKLGMLLEASQSTFIDQNGGKLKWKVFKNIHALQQQKGLKHSNRLTWNLKNIR